MYKYFLSFHKDANRMARLEFLNFLVLVKFMSAGPLEVCVLVCHTITSVQLAAKGWASPGWMSSWRRKPSSS